MAAKKAPAKTAATKGSAGQWAAVPCYLCSGMIAELKLALRVRRVDYAGGGKSYPERLDGWLRSVPVKGDQLAALVVGDSPGAGGRRRTMIVLDLDDFIAWFGKEDNAKEEA